LRQTLSLASASVVSAQNNCNNLNQLKGSFGYTVTGTILPGALLGPGPFAAVGRIVFDGMGGVTTVRSLSDNGYIATGDSGTGSYSLNKDCTGSFNITVGTPSGTVVLHLNMVLDDHNQIRAIVTDQYYVLVLDGRMQM
jgi:hypothetical protein